MSLMTRRALGVAALLVLVSSASAWAGAPTERLRTFFDEANRVLTAPETHADPLEALARVKRLVNDIFDFRGAAEQALGPAWQVRSRAERDEFTALFAELLQKNFVGRVATKARMDGGLNVRYLDEQIEGDTATVRTAVEARDGHELRLEYRMVKRWPRGWKVRDVAMDGVGLLANYQAQFARLLHSGSYAELVAQMRAKAQPSPELLAQLAEPEELPPSAAPAAVVAAAPLPPPVVAAPAPAPATPDVAAIVPSSARASAPAPMPPAEIIAPPPARAAAPASVAAAPRPATALPIAVAPPPAQPVAPSPAPTPAPVVVSPPAPPPSAEPIKPVAPSRIAALPSSPPADVAPSKSTQGVRAIAARVSYWVQLGVFRSAESATKFAAGVTDPKLTLETGPGLALRVLVGPFADKVAAVSKARELRSQGYSTQIREAPRE